MATWGPRRAASCGDAIRSPAVERSSISTVSALSVAGMSKAIEPVRQLSCDPTLASPVMSPVVGAAACTVPELATRSVSCGFVIGSGCSSIFVDHAAQDTKSTDRGVERDDVGGIMVGWAVLAAPGADGDDH
jgi:hypothetical protein